MCENYYSVPPPRLPPSSPLLQDEHTYLPYLPQSLPRQLARLPGAAQPFEATEMVKILSFNLFRSILQMENEIKEAQTSGFHLKYCRGSIRVGKMKATCPQSGRKATAEPSHKPRSPGRGPGHDHETGLLSLQLLTPKHVLMGAFPP